MQDRLTATHERMPIPCRVTRRQASAVADDHATRGKMSESTPESYHGTSL
jgi:hypothetical protein